MQAAQQKQAEDAAAAAANQPFDHFMGNDTGAFAYGDYDQDDKEADDTYAKIEDTMDERRKVRPHRSDQRGHAVEQEVTAGGWCWGATGAREQRMHKRCRNACRCSARSVRRKSLLLSARRIR